MVPAADEFLKIAPALDLVVVSTPQNARAAGHGGAGRRCRVVIDKPFAVSADEARDLAALAARYGRLAIPFQNRRWDADILTLQRLCGKARSVSCTARVPLRRWRPTPKPRWTVEGAGAHGEGLLLDLMVHLADQALLLFGRRATSTPSSIATTRRCMSWTTCSSRSPTRTACARTCSPAPRSASAGAPERPRQRRRVRRARG